MKICDIINKEDIVSISVDLSTEVGKPTDNSAHICRGDIFFATDKSEKFAFDALSRGAAAVVVTGEKSENADYNCYIGVKDVRHAYAVACQNYYGRPGDRMVLSAVTGTNGKTSVSMILGHIIAFSGKKAGIIGTTGNIIDGEKTETSYTTPPPDKLAELLHEMIRCNTEYAVMEASSHALDQRRLDGLCFEVGIFTNLTRDHMDYHKTVEDYAAAKSRLFGMSRKSVINLDDGAAKYMGFSSSGDVYYCSEKDKNAEFFADNISVGISKTDFDIISPFGNVEIRSSLTGRFYVTNIMLASAAAMLLGIEPSVISSAVAGFKGVDGRMESVGGLPVFIDYAHTPDALEKVLLSLKELSSGRIITVFGCGGDRDRGKRPMMGKIAEKYSDIIVVTSDNPRSEEPGDIIKEITGGISDKSRTVTIEDRAAAIKYALSVMQSGDTVLIAGKGHENYSIDKLGKHYFSDRDEVLKYINEVKKKCISD